MARADDNKEDFSHSGGKSEIFKSWFFRKKSKTIKEILEQFYLILRVRYYTLKDNQKESANVAICQEIEIKLDGSERSWPKAYYIELLLVHLYVGSELKVELDHRLDEADHLGLTVAVKSRERVKELDDSDEAIDEERRAILHRLVSLIQWSYTKKNVARSYGGKMAERVTMLTFLTMLFVAVPALISAIGIGDNIFLQEALTNLPNYGLLNAISFGVLGASFSMLVSMGSRLSSANVDDIRVNYEYRMLALRIAVGGAGALMLYFFYKAGLVDGVFFPDLSKLGYEREEVVTLFDNLLRDNEPGKSTVLVPTADTCKLIAWSFIAGFSETLVPTILSKTEE